MVSPRSLKRVALYESGNVATLGKCLNANHVAAPFLAVDAGSECPGLVDGPQARYNTSIAPLAQLVRASDS